VEFISFDSGYVERLAAGDPAVEAHFNKYFGELIHIKLRSRQFASTAIDDIRQEVFLRVFQALRREGIRQPERIGAYVNSVCNHVMMEFGRAGSRITYTDEPPDPPDEGANSERDLIESEGRAQVRHLLGKMSPKNKRLLTEVVLLERPADEVCAEMGIDRNYLRVLLFRARTQLKQAVKKGSKTRTTNGKG
jgi:RNA polymerase sigma-70 factor (ECF subfamily)